MHQRAKNGKDPPGKGLSDRSRPGTPKGTKAVSKYRMEAGGWVDPRSRLSSVGALGQF